MNDFRDHLFTPSSYIDTESIDEGALGAAYQHYASKLGSFLTGTPVGKINKATNNKLANDFKSDVKKGWSSNVTNVTRPYYNNRRRVADYNMRKRAVLHGNPLGGRLDLSRDHAEEYRRKYAPQVGRFGQINT